MPILFLPYNSSSLPGHAKGMSPLVCFQKKKKKSFNFVWWEGADIIKNESEP